MCDSAYAWYAVPNLRNQQPSLGGQCKQKWRLGVRVSSRPLDFSKNRLLAALPPDELERLLPTLQQISFSLGDVVYEFSGHLDYVYFPTTAIVSLLYTMENGSTAEMGLTGNDGVVGMHKHASNRATGAEPGRDAAGMEWIRAKFFG